MSRLPLPLLDRVLVWCSNYTWREGRVGNAFHSGRVDIVVDDKGLLPVAFFVIDMLLSVCYDC